MIVGTAGHVDHGKTALVKALTGVDTDRLKEEKERGISIDLGFAYLSAPDGEVLGFIDVPGHERFVRTMLAGASGIDFVLLVVAADDGIMPQTREHLAIVELLGVERGIVALAKADLAAEERRVQVSTDVDALLAPTLLAGAPVIPVSASTGEGIERLRDALFEANRAFARRVPRGRFRLAIDRSFTLRGAGTVVTGTVLSGEVRVGDCVTVTPTGLDARVRSIHAQSRATEAGVVGERCALNLTGDRISKDAIRRGDMAVDPFLHAPSARIDAQLRLLPGEGKAIGQWTPVRLHHAAAEVGAHIVLLEGERLLPGSENRVQLVLERPIAATVGDRFVVRDPPSMRTMGGGLFLDVRAPARRRRTARRLTQLAVLAEFEPQRVVRGLLARDPHWLDLTAFARDRALSDYELDDIVAVLTLKRISVPDAVIGLDAGSWQRFERSLAATLAAFHERHPDLPGIPPEQLRLEVKPRLSAQAFLSALGELARQELIAIDGACVRLAQHAVRLLAKDEALWLRISPMLAGDRRFRPPRVADVAASVGLQDSEVRRLLKTVGRQRQADEVAPDLFFLRRTVVEIVGIAMDLGSKGDFTAAQFRDRLATGRRTAIEILEFLDRHGVTLRRGDLRRINPRRTNHFGAAGAPAINAETVGREGVPVNASDFKSGRGREPVLGGFDSHSLPPTSRKPA